MRNLIVKNLAKSFRVKLYAGFAVFVVCLSMLLVAVSIASQRSIELEAANKVAGLNSALGHALQDRISTVTLSVNLVSMQLDKKLINTHSDVDVSKFMDEVFQESSFIKTIRVMNASGEAVLNTHSSDGTKTNWRDRAYFQYHETHDDRSVLISKPIMGRTLGKPIVAFTQRYNQADGSFGGIVLAAVEVDAFQKLLASVEYDKNGFGLLRYQDDLSFLTRYPLDVSQPQDQLDNTLVSDQLRAFHVADVEFTTNHLQTAPDGHERINAFSRVPNTPFVLVVSAAATDYDVAWRQQALILASLGCVLVILGWGITQWLLRNMATIEDQEQTMRALFETSAAGIVRTNMAGQFVEFNQAFAEICGYPEAELKVLDYWTLTPKRFMPDEQRQIESMKKHQRYGPYRKQYVRKDGRLVDVELTGSVIRNPAGESFVWSIVTDISQLLQDRQKLVLAKQVAEAADLAKTQFLGTMSHELRTPLNGIEGMAQLLKRVQVSDVDRIEAAEIIIRSSQLLTVLLSDLLDASQMAANKLVLRPVDCDVGGLIQELATLFTPAAQKKNVDMLVDWQGQTGQHYRVDAIRLRQMLSNLVGNALKFTPSGFIRIQGAEIVRTDNAVILEFSVHDSGVGIPPDKQDLLFKRFSQIENEKTDLFQGAGLGLSIVKGLATRMGGSVGVESTENKGSRFWFQIQVVAVAVDRADVSRLQPAVEAGAHTAAHVLAKLAVVNDDDDSMPADERVLMALVVEDNPINQKVMSRFLDEIDMPAMCVGNGQEALNSIQQGMRPKFILMDVQMPVMNGWEATKAIREWEASHVLPRTPIIGLTAGASDGDKGKCMDSGMDEVLFKPVDLDELEALIIRLTSA